GVAMRRKVVLGVGLAGILSGSAAAQFGGNPPIPSSPTPAPSGFAAGRPVGTPAPGAAPRPAGGYVAPVGGFQPAGGAAPPVGGFQPAGGALTPPPEVEIPLALGPNHPRA